MCVMPTLVARVCGRSPVVTVATTGSMVVVVRQHWRKATAAATTSKRLWKFMYPVHSLNEAAASLLGMRYLKKSAARSPREFPLAHFFVPGAPVIHLSRRCYTPSGAPGAEQHVIVPEMIEVDCITIETLEGVRGSQAPGSGSSTKSSSSGYAGGFTFDVSFGGDSPTTMGFGNPSCDSVGPPAESKEEQRHGSSITSSCSVHGEESNVSTASSESSSSPSNSSSGGAPYRESYWNVHKVDAFARGRILNYLRRMGMKGSGSPFQVKRTSLSESDSAHNDHNAIGRVMVLYTATLHLPLPTPHGSYVAEGVGETAKDAELLAAMHAERVCDALGVPLFRLPSMQQKYAENVRRTEGRYAPLPGEPLKPEGTPVPPPLRMVSAAMEGGGQDHGTSTAADVTTSSSTAGVGSETGTGVTSSLFHSGIAEAEIVEPSSLSRRLAHVETRSARPEKESREKATSVSSTENGTTAEWIEAYRKEMSFPWLLLGTSSPGGGASASPASSSGGGGYDPTEGGCWQMANVISMRLSPSKEALSLPCVLDTDATERLMDHFLQRGIGKKLSDCFTVTHVVHPGSASRIYIAELNLHQRSLHAMGKAQNKEVAKQLAAMHAELLLDALALPLFPKDDARQARHAQTAAQFGRWALNPLDTDSELHKANVQAAQTQDLVLPLPLKQMVGGDDVWVDTIPTYARSEGERIIAAQSELNYLCSNAMEVYPPESLLEEAQQTLSRWQREVVQNPYPDCFILTKMGDFIRAATLTPVPRRFGVRGGIAIARTPAQAVALCSLHAVDSLTALGIPLFADPTEQEDYLRRRRAMGMVTPEVFLGLAHPRDWEPLEPSVVREAKLEEEVSNFVTIEKSQQREEDPTSTSRMWWRYLQDAMTHNFTAMTNSSGVRRPALIPPYLPVYLTEGSQPRRMPYAEDTSRVMQLAVLRDFDEFGKNCKEEDLVAIGNEVKICVHNYLRHQYAIAGCGTDPVRMDDTWGCKTNSNAKASAPPEGWGHLPPPLVPSVCITGYGRTGASVHNIAYLRLPPPTRRQAVAASGAKESKAAKKKRRLTSLPVSHLLSTAAGPTTTLTEGDGSGVSASGPPQEDLTEPLYTPLAVGISLKKKDAERACYLHAASLLYHVYGEDVMAKHRAGLPRLSVVSSFDTLIQKCFLGLDYGEKKEEADARTPSSSSTGGARKSAVEQPIARLPPPKALIHTTMKTFVHAGKYVTSVTAGQKPNYKRP